MKCRLWESDEEWQRSLTIGGAGAVGGDAHPRTEPDHPPTPGDRPSGPSQPCGSGRVIGACGARAVALTSRAIRALLMRTVRRR
jgi:hypothetical protein